MVLLVFGMLLLIINVNMYLRKSSRTDTYKNRIKTKDLPIKQNPTLCELTKRKVMH